MHNARVYNAFGGKGICIETPKGRVALQWAEINCVMSRVAALEFAHNLIEETELHNRAIVEAQAERDKP